MEQYKQKIIKKGIIQEKDWDHATLYHKKLAYLLMNISEIDHFKKNHVSSYEVLNFLNESKELNDFLELEQIDKVELNKSFEGGIDMRIPIEIIPFLNEVISEIKN